MGVVSRRVKGEEDGAEERVNERQLKVNGETRTEPEVLLDVSLD